MALAIQTNIGAINAQRQLNGSTQLLNRGLERLSSGFRINRAADDAAGLSIANNLRAQLYGLKAASRNASQASSMAQTAEGAVNEIYNMLVRLRELAVSAASDNNDANARAALDAERAQLISEIDRIVDSTEFNGVTLLDGTFGQSLAPGGWSAAIDTAVERIDEGLSNVTIDASKVAAGTTFTFVDVAADQNIAVAADIGDGGGVRTVTMSLTATTLAALGPGETLELNFEAIGLRIEFNASFDDDAGLNNVYFVAQSSGSASSFQVGADNTVGNTITLSVADFSTTGSTLGLSGNLLTQSAANTYIGTVDTSITNLNSELGNLGAFQNRLSYASANLATSIENTASAESVIRDADMASETTDYTKAQILVQAGVSILAQANASQQAVLALLQM